MSLATITKTALSFEGRTYPSDAFGVLLQAFGLSALSIEVEPPVPDEDGSKNFTLKGTTELLSHAVGVELYMDFVRDGAFEFQLKTTLPTVSWTTLRQLGVLPDSRFVRPLLASPVDYPDTQVVFDSDGGRLAFVAPESTASIDLFPKLSLTRLGFGLLKSYAQGSTRLDLYATLQLGTTPIEVKIAVPLGASLEPVCWALNSRSAISLNKGLADLATLLTGTFGLSSADVFPESLGSIPTFVVSDVQLLLDPVAQPTLRYLTFRIHTVHDLPLGGGVTLRNVGMRVDVVPGASRPEISLSLFGEIRVKDAVVLDLQVMLPPNLSRDPWTLFMSGGVELGGADGIQQLPVGHDSSDLQLHPSFFKLTSLDLKGFEVSFNPVARTLPGIVFDLAAHASFELFHGFALKDPRFAFHAQNPFDQAGLPNKSLTGSLSGTIALGDINFGITADKRADGWDFKGETAPGGIPIGQMAGAFADHYGIHVPKVVQEHLTLEGLGMGFSTSAGQSADASTTVTFHAEGTFPLGTTADSKVARLTFATTIHDDPSAKQYEHSFGGALQVGKVGFSTRYDEDASRSAFVGAYPTPEGDPVNLTTLLSDVAPSLGKLVPDGLNVAVKDALFGFSKTGQDERKFVFGIDLALTFDFSRLPLVGGGLAAAKGAIGFENLQVLYASRDFSGAEAQALNRLLDGIVPPLSHRLPVPATKPAPGDAPSVLRAGLNFAAVLNLAGTIRPLAFPTAGPQETPQDSGGQAFPNATSTDSAFWLDVQKAVGPLQLQRVGIEYRDGLVWLLLSASLSAAELTIALDGLSLGAPLRDFTLDKLRASLRGLGIDYRNDAVEIGGSFLAVQPSKPSDPDEYSGSAVLKARGLTLSALGSYTTLNERSSFFLYALLDYPLGGPAFFFVTGLAAGFGYNRGLLIPPVEQVGRFALVRAALSPEQDRTTGLAELGKEVPAQLGEHFLAAGVAFTSFKLVQSFVLLTVAFGKRLELRLVGLSKLRLPAAAEGDTLSPIAEVELALTGSYVPADGFLELRALLTPTSYLFNRDCHLTGGFAFMCWFAKQGDAKPSEDGPAAGDFVLTLGGYHPQFHVPAHYPTVPRLAFKWEVVPELSLQGDVYCALTPAAVMAGGHLEAEWRSGSVLAWFKAGLDFIIAWKPYHYDVSAYVDLGAQVTFEFFGTQRLTLEVGADLHMWGPELSGDATVHLWIISFTIHFGDAAAHKPAALAWADVERSFLTSLPRNDQEPALPQICSLALSAGLVGGTARGPDDLGIVDAKHLRIVSDARIPSTKAFHTVPRAEPPGSAPPPTPTEIQVANAAPAFGVAPMAVARVDASVHTLELARLVNGKAKPAGHLFAYTPLHQNVPAALWGSSLEARLNGPTFVDQALVGFELRPADPSQPDETQSLDRDKLLVDSGSKAQLSHWEHDVPAFLPEPSAEDARRAELTRAFASEAAGIRDALLAGLGFEVAKLDLDPTLTYDFLTAPEIELAQAA